MRGRQFIPLTAGSISVLAPKKIIGSTLSVFSGKEASLNRIILLTLDTKKLLANYDMYREIRRVKGFRHVDYRTVQRRMAALEKKGWIVQNGSKRVKPGWDSGLYEITIRSKVALKLHRKSIDEFLQTASEEQLIKLLDALE
jgi:hypothetical protein